MNRRERAWSMVGGSMPVPGEQRADLHNRPVCRHRQGHDAQDDLPQVTPVEAVGGGSRGGDGRGSLAGAAGCGVASALGTGVMLTPPSTGVVSTVGVRSTGDSTVGTAVEASVGTIAT